MNKVKTLAVSIALLSCASVNAADANFTPGLEFSLGVNSESVIAGTRLFQKGKPDQHIMLDMAIQDNGDGESDSGIACGGFGVGNYTFVPKNVGLTVGMVVCGARNEELDLSAVAFPVHLGAEIPFTLVTNNRFLKALVLEGYVRYAPDLLTYGNKDEGADKLYDYSVGFSINPLEGVPVKLSLHYKRSAFGHADFDGNVEVFDGIYFGGSAAF